MSEEISHIIDGGGGGVVSRFQPPPAFLTKTFKIVNDPNTNSIISWGKLGESFIIWQCTNTSQLFQTQQSLKLCLPTQQLWFSEDRRGSSMGVFTSRFPSGEATSPLKHEKKIVLAKSNSETPKKRMLRNGIEESKHEINKLKMQHFDTDFHVMELEQGINDIEAIYKKMTAHWAKACEIVAKRKREDYEEVVCMGEKKKKKKKKKKVAVYEEIPSENNDNKDDHDEYETVKENTISSSSKDEEEILGDYLNDWKRVLLEGDDEVCGVEDEGSEIAKQRSQLDKDFQEFLTQTSIHET